MDFKVVDHTEQVLNACDSAIEKFLLEAGLHLSGQAAKALEMDPRRVDTGLLRNSITFALDGEAAANSHYEGSAVHGDTETTRRNKVAGKPAPPPREGNYSGIVPAEGASSRALYIGTNVEYAVYVHEGTRRMAPNRFIYNAVMLNMEQFRENLKEALENA